MLTYERMSDVVRENVVLAGELRAPVNIAADRKGGIHDDETARQLGFQGGLVSGLIHNEQFTPLASAGVDAAVTLEGGTEVRFVDGPVFLDKGYLLSGRVLRAGQSRKTEDLWFESSLRDPESGSVVAEMLMIARWMKNSSTLYADQGRAGSA